MKTIGQHTCENRGDLDYIESNAPFISGGSMAFLGVGYYFWEDSLDLAHWWGEFHCDNDYVICEGNIDCQEELFLDLVGTPSHLRYLKELIVVLEPEILREFKRKDVELGRLIEFLKLINTKAMHRGIFPFKVIKAVDNHNPGPHQIGFVPKKQNYTTLMPKIMLCLVEKRSILSNLQIVFP